MSDRPIAEIESELLRAIARHVLWTTRRSEENEILKLLRELRQADKREEKAKE